MIPLNIRNFSGRTLEQIVKYLQADLSSFLKSLQAAMAKLSFADNFATFSKTFTVAAGATATIQNLLGTPALEWVVVDVQGDSRLVRDPTDADAIWTANFVYLKNAGATSITATVRFFRG